MVVMISSSLEKKQQRFQFRALTVCWAAYAHTPHSVSPIFSLPLLPPSLHILLHPVSFTLAVFFSRLHSLCLSPSFRIPLYRMSLIIFLPLSLACCAQPAGLWGVCFPLACYAESCHMRVWTCWGGVLMWCWHMHALLLCSGQGQRRGRGTEWRGEVNWGQGKTSRCKSENRT